MDKLISVIVPVYNSEAFLDDCIQSLFQQTYKNLEILLIDDGSQDKSGMICDSYQNVDTRIKCIHQKNCGVSNARNRGLEIAKGEFIIFVDSDDFVEPNYVQELYKNIIGYDIAICGIGRFIHGKKQADSINSCIYNKNQLICEVLESQYVGGYPVNKIFKKSIIDKYNIRFNDQVHIGEDMLWILQYLSHCNNGKYISKTLYYYRLNENSMLQSSIFQKHFNPKNMEVPQVNDLLRKEISENTPDIVSALAYRYVRSNMRLLFNMIVCKYREKQIFTVIQKQTRNNIRSFLKNKLPSTLEKIVSISMAVSMNMTFIIGVLGNMFFSNYLKKYLN